MSTFAQAALGQATGQSNLPDAIDFSDDLNGFADAFPAMVRLKIGSETYNVPCLTNDDYVPWLDELVKAQRLIWLANVPKNATAVERWKINSNIQERELIPSDMINYLWRPKWVKIVVLKALENAKIPGDIAEAWYAKRPPLANAMFAHLVSGLLTTNQFQRMFEVELRSFSTGGKASVPFKPTEPANEEPDLKSTSPDDSEASQTGPLSEHKSNTTPVEALVE
jgi:hypothetical protein